MSGLGLGLGLGWLRVTLCVCVSINRVRLPILLVVSLTGKMEISLSPFAPENLSRDVGSAVLSRVSPLILHTRAESGAYVRDSAPPSHSPLRFPSDSSCAIGLVPSLSVHATA